MADDMIGFEVRLNGRRLCTAGAGEGVLDVPPGMSSA